MAIRLNELRKSMLYFHLLMLLKKDPVSLKRELKTFIFLSREERNEIIKLTEKEFEIHQQRRELLSDAINKRYALEVHEAQHQDFQNRLSKTKKKK